MISIESMMRPDLVFLNLEAPERFESFRMIAASLCRRGWIPEDTQAELGERLTQTEKIHSTALADGFAMPHCYFEAIPEPMIVFARFRTALDFESDDGHPVDKVFLLVGPKRDNTEHLRILARMARLLRDDEFKRRVSEAASGRDVIAAVRDVETRH